ncbi:hypothetical protein [Nocardia canadensis]|uniref:hypothetical protein n=1 Tax=Nocardia canadensis TaxID=3065238 RepID=UPI002931C421|nr:hypothetical protein [Nocardia canadensis]
MSDTVDDLWRLLAQAGNMPYGDSKDALLEQVLRHADAGGHTDLAFRTRMRLITAYAQGMSPAKLFVPFARCLADYDRDPGAYEEWVASALRWDFKFAVRAMTNFPEVPKDRALAALDQMEQRYRLEGQSLHAVHAYRHYVAEHLGDLAEAERWYERWCTTPRDENSDCAGCDPTGKVAWLAMRGRDAEAVELAAPVLRGELHCNEQPQLILTALLLPYLRTGQLDAARDAHRRSYRVLRTKPQDLRAIATHLEFCALSGNQARGLELLDRHLGWLDRSPNPSAAMDFAAAAALLLRTVDDAGHGDTVVRRPAHLERPAAESTARDLRQELTAEALAIAARFDQRNGTAHQTEQVRAVLARTPIVDRLPLSAAAAHRAPVEPAPAPIALPALTTAELIDRAELGQERDATVEVTALAQRLTEAAEPTDPLLAGRRAAVLARESARHGDSNETESLLRQAIEHYTAAGDEDRRQGGLGRLGAHLCRHGDPAEATSLLRASLAHLGASADPAVRAGAILRLSGGLLDLFDRGLLADDDAAELPELLDRAAAEAAASGGDELIGDVARQRMYLSENNSRIDDADAAARTAISAFHRANLPLRAATTLYHLSGIRRSAAEFDTALTLLDEAMPLLDTDTPIGFRMAVYARRGDLLLHLDRAAEAVGELLTAIAIGAPVDLPQVPYARWDLAIGYRSTGQLLDAAEQAESAILALDRAGAGGPARGCRYLLAGLHRSLGEHDQALAVYDAIIEFDRAVADLGDEAYVLAETADLLDSLDRDAEAAERYRLAAEVAARVDDPIRVAYCRYSAALSLHWAGDSDGAVAAVDVADAALAELAATRPDADLLTWHRARLDHNAARILHSASRLPDALPRAEAAAAGFRAIEVVDRAVRADYDQARILLGLDRAAEAEKVLAGAVAELDDTHPAYGPLSGLLTETRSRLG